MKNIGNKKYYYIIMIIIFIYSQKLYSEDYQEDNIHFKMLKKLKIEKTEEESLLRRGEIVFFISFGYLWMYQFLLYDQLLAPTFNDKSKIGELSNKNLYFAILTSIITALFIARNDNLFINYVKYSTVYNYESKKVTYSQIENRYDWYFNFFSWEF